MELFTQRKMAALLLLGFSSGLPLYPVTRTLQAWMSVENVDLTTIGLFSLVTLPYSFKFLWAPLLDRYIPPFLGRRRGWIVIAQVGLLLSLAAMSLHDPERSLRLLAFNAVLIAFFSATQDIAFDAYKVDVLEEREMGIGASLGVLGYRVALLVTGSLALILADMIPWTTVYLLLAAFTLIGIASAVWAPEPLVHEPPLSLRAAVVDPFREFFERSGGWLGVTLVTFVVIYQLPDRFAGVMVTPFLLDIGFSQTEIGAIQGGLGLGATIAGVMAGGVFVAALGINRALWIFAIVQLATNLAYYWLARVGASGGALVSATLIENFATGLVTAVFVAYLMSLCSRRFSATQFALLSSLMAAARDLLVAPGGRIAEVTGWPTFFLLTVAVGLPVLFLLPMVAPWAAPHPRGAAEHSGEIVDPGVSSPPGPRGEA